MRIFFMQGDRFYYIQPVIRVSKKKIEEQKEILFLTNKLTLLFYSVFNKTKCQFIYDCFPDGKECCSYLRDGLVLF